MHAAIDADWGALGLPGACSRLYTGPPFNRSLCFSATEHSAHLQVDQAQLETVLPAPGGSVVVVRGSREGTSGKLQEIDTEKFRAQVLLANGQQEWFDYEDICKHSAGSRVQALKGHAI